MSASDPDIAGPAVTKNDRSFREMTKMTKVMTDTVWTLSKFNYFKDNDLDMTLTPSSTPVSSTPSNCLCLCRQR
ncbi:hypothetical protein PM082_014344 [Marasmius tenuissimus]|nr:hypothetical protein PM082_014344 [Marasmius tenuissimus]